VRKLIGKANERGGPDNVTVQIVWLADPQAAAQPAPGPRREVQAPPRSVSLPLLAGTAAVLVALILVLVLYGLGEGPMPTGDPAPELEAKVAPVAPAPASPKASAPPVAQLPFPPEAVKLAAEQREAEQKAAEKKAAEAKAAQAKAAKAKLAQAEAAEARAAAAGPPNPRPPSRYPGESAVPEAPAPVEPAAPWRPSAPRWSASLQLGKRDREPGLRALEPRLAGEQASFQSDYVDQQAKLSLALRDEQTAPDQPVVRVQMVLERRPSASTRRRAIDSPDCRRLALLRSVELTHDEYSQ
jgi:hypothetical protein